jgi:hypothetical protein
MVSNETAEFIARLGRGALISVSLGDGSEFEARLREVRDGCLFLEDEDQEIPLDRIKDIGMIVRTEGPE